MVGLLMAGTPADSLYVTPAPWSKVDKEDGRETSVPDRPTTYDALSAAVCWDLNGVG